MTSGLLKMFVYFGSFVSQVSTFLLLVLIVRNASIQQVAFLAIVDGVLLFLPFLFSMMSERTAIAIWYENSREKGNEIFATGTVLVLLTSAIGAVVVIFFASFISIPHLETTLFVILAASGIAVFNIQLQKQLIAEAYFSVVTLQLIRGLSVITLPFIILKFTQDAIIVYALAISLGCYFAATHQLIITLSGWHYNSFQTHFQVVYRMGKVSLVVLLFGFLLANLGRYALSLSGHHDALALLLVHTKSTVLVLSALTPFANFLKPKIMREYSINRVHATSYWNALIFASLFAALVSITYYDQLLSLWGDNFHQGGHIEFSILLAGSLIMWLLGAGVDIFFDHSKFLKKKMFIYGFPLTVLIVALYTRHSDLDLLFVITSVVVTQALILFLALFRAFPKPAAVSAYMRAVLMCAVVICYGIIFDWLSKLVLDTFVYSNIVGFLFLSGYVWTVFFYKRQSHVSPH